METVLKNPGSVVLTENTAIKYFQFRLPEKCDEQSGGPG